MVSRWVLEHEVEELRKENAYLKRELQLAQTDGRVLDAIAAWMEVRKEPPAWQPYEPPAKD